MRHLLTPCAALLLAVAALMPNAARADSIDGNWCTDTGLRMTIQGPSLVSPGGARMAGDYTRHGFSYTAPAGEPGGGGTVTLTLMGENMVRAQAASGSIEPTWRRCGPPVS
ncbi:hypothetical protein [Roseomonas sp. AR75]|jgi:hypothetical protein|uniref:hypothetical protein n=1 Tax=Roseomonas sp. AR75 TaxID=2562311 RepID=UPI0010C07DB7|nr:hypothetical protein [Roseomonas sp. AR75]